MEGSVKNSIVLSSNTNLFLLGKVLVNKISLYKYNVEINYEEYKKNYTVLSETSIKEFEKIPKDKLESYILSEISKNENNGEIYIGKLSVNDAGELMVSYNEKVDGKINKNADEVAGSSSSHSNYGVNSSQTASTQMQVDPGSVNCNFDKVNEFSMKLREVSGRATAVDIDDTLQNDINKIKDACNTKCNFSSTNNILSEVSAELGHFRSVGGGNTITKLLEILKNQDNMLAKTILEQKEDELKDNEELKRNISGRLLTDEEYRKAYEDAISLLKSDKEGYSFADVYNSFIQIEQRDFKLNMGDFLAATGIWDENQMTEFTSKLKNLGYEDIKSMTWDEFSSGEVQYSMLLDMYSPDELMKLMSEFYATDEGHEYLRNQIAAVTGHYDDSLINTEYVKYCMDQNQDSWLPPELQNTVGALRVIEEDNYCNKYTWLKEEMLFFMDTELNEGEKWDTAFSEKATGIAIYNNDKLQYMNTHSSLNGVSAEEQWNILEDIEADRNGVLEKLKNNGELSYNERCNNRAALNELCEVVGIPGYKEKTVEQIKTDLKNLGLDSNDLSDSKKILALIKEEKLNKLTEEQRLAVTTAALNLRNETAFGNETVVLGLKFTEGVHKFGENVVDMFVTLGNSDIFLDNYGKDELDEIKEIAEYYEMQYNDAWSKHVQDLLDKKETWFNSEEYQKYYYNAMQELSLKTYTPFADYNSTFYVPSEETIQATAWQNYLKDTFTYTGVTTTDHSSSSLYISTLKDAILGNSINYEKILKNDTALYRVNEQFDAMDYVIEDKTTNKFNNIYNSTWFEQVEDLSLIKRDNIIAETTQQIGTMAIPIALGFVPVVGRGLSTAALGFSAFGGAAEESFVSGAGYNQAIAYGTVSAATEMAVEQLFSGIGGLGKGLLDESLENGLAKVVKEFADNSKVIKKITEYTSDKLVIQVAKELAGKGIGEGVEEVFTDLVTPITQYLLYQSDITDQTLAEYWDEQVSCEGLVHTFLVSALSGMVFGSIDINMQTNTFNQNAALLDSMLSEYPQLQEYKTKVLAELIGTEITSDSYRTLNIIDNVIAKVSKDMAKNEAAVSELSSLKEKLSSKVENIRSSNVEIKVNDKIVTIPQDALLDAANTVRKSKYSRSTFSKYITEIDGKVTIEEGKQTQFAKELYNYINGCKKNLIELSYKVTDDDLKTKINEAIESCENASKNNFEGLSKLFELDLQELNKNYKDSEIDSKAVNEKINETIKESLENVDRSKIIDVLNTHKDLINKIQKANLSSALKNIDNAQKEEFNFEQKQKIKLESLEQSQKQELVEQDKKIQDAINETLSVEELNTKKQDLIVKHEEELLNKTEEEQQVIRARQEQEIKEIDNLIENNSTENIEAKKELVSELEQEKQNIIERHNSAKNDLLAKQESEKSAFIAERNVFLASQAANIISSKQVGKRTDILRNKLKVAKNKTTVTNTTNSETIVTTRVIVFDDIKSNVDSYMDSIKNKIKLFVKNNKNVSDFKTKFDNFKQEINLEYEAKINEFKQEIRNSYSNSIESINKKLEGLSENSDEYKILLVQRDNLISQRESSINELDSYVKGSLDSIISSINVEIISSNLNTVAVSIFENISKDLESFISKVRNDCQEFIKNSSLKIENINEFKLKQKELFDSKVASLKEKLNVIGKENLTQKHLEQFNQMIENAKNRFNESMSNLTETTKAFINNATSNFEGAINTGTNIRNSVRNAFNNLNPNSTVNKFASKITDLTKTFNELNIKEIVDSYVKSVETTSDIKVTEELIKNLDSKLTDSQKQKLVNTLEEIGAFVKHYGIEGENLNKFYSSITMEENPSKVIKKEVTKEKIAKLKDKKQFVKNAAIGTIIATSYHINSPGTIASVFIYNNMYNYVEIRKRTGTATESTMLGKMLENKLGKFVNSKIEVMKTGIKTVETVVSDTSKTVIEELIDKDLNESIIEKNNIHDYIQDGRLTEEGMYKICNNKDINLLNKLIENKLISPKTEGIIKLLIDENTTFTSFEEFSSIINGIEEMLNSIIDENGNMKYETWLTTNDKDITMYEKYNLLKIDTSIFNEIQIQFKEFINKMDPSGYSLSFIDINNLELYFNGEIQPLFVEELLKNRPEILIEILRYESSTKYINIETLYADNLKMKSILETLRDTPVLDNFFLVNNVEAYFDNNGLIISKLVIDLLASNIGTLTQIVESDGLLDLTIEQRTLIKEYIDIKENFGIPLHKYIDENLRIQTSLFEELLSNGKFDIVSKITTNPNIDLSEFTPQQQTYLKCVDILKHTLSFDNLDTYIDESGRIKVNLIEELLLNKEFDIVIQIALNSNIDLSNFTPQQQTYLKCLNYVSSFVKDVISFDNLDEYIDESGNIKLSLISLIQKLGYHDIAREIIFNLNLDLSNFTKQQIIYCDKYNSLHPYMSLEDASTYIDENGCIEPRLIQELYTKRKFNTIEYIMNDSKLDLSKFTPQQIIYWKHWYFRSNNVISFENVSTYIDENGCIEPRLIQELYTKGNFSTIECIMNDSELDLSKFTPQQIFYGMDSTNMEIYARISFEDANKYLDEKGQIKVILIEDLLAKGDYYRVSEIAKNFDLSNFTEQQKTYMRYSFDLRNNISFNNLDNYIDDSGYINPSLIQKLLDEKEHYILSNIISNSKLNLSNFTEQQKTYVKLLKSKILCDLSFDNLNGFIGSDGRINVGLIELLENRKQYNYISMILSVSDLDLGNFTPQQKTYMKYSKNINGRILFNNLDNYIDSNGNFKYDAIKVLWDNVNYSNDGDMDFIFNSGVFSENILNQFLENSENLRIFINCCTELPSVIQKSFFSILHDIDVNTGQHRYETLSEEKIYELKDCLNVINESNSKEIKVIQSELAIEILKADNPIECTKEICNIFEQNHLPYVGKVFKVFELLNLRFDSSFVFSPTLLENVSEREMFKTISASMEGLTDVGKGLNLRKGSKLFIQLRDGKIKYEELSSREQKQFRQFINELNELYGIKNSNDINESISLLNDVITRKSKLKIIFSDLVRISFGSNNRSAIEYLNIIEKGNLIFEQIRDKKIGYEQLSVNDKKIIGRYLENLNRLYNQSQAGRNKPYVLKEKYDVVKTIQEFSKKFNQTSRYSLPDRLVRSFAYDAGFKTFDQLKNYTISTIQNAHNRNIEYANANPKLVIGEGDLIKASKPEFITSYLQNGNIAAEFLGKNIRLSSSTWFDADYFRIPNIEVDGGVVEFNRYLEKGYGKLASVVRYNPNRMEVTKFYGEEETHIYENTSKLEVFSSPVAPQAKELHYGVRTGNPSSDISYFVAESQDIQMVSFEIVRNGFYIPVYDYNGDLVFTPSDYEKLRLRMQGSSYYNTGKYEFASEVEKFRSHTINVLFENLRKSDAPLFKIPIIKKLIGEDISIETQTIQNDVREIFTFLKNGDLSNPDIVSKCYERLKNGQFNELILENAKSNSDRLHMLLQISKLDAVRKKNTVMPIFDKVFGEMGLKVKNGISDSVTRGSVEIIDTGSTGRNANVPGDGDFDFTIKLDSKDLSIEKTTEIANKMKELIGNENIGADESFTNNGVVAIRLKQVTIKGLDVPIDIDVSFVGKTLDVQYSTDMALADRYDSMSDNLYQRDLVVAELINMKNLLKNAGAYKKGVYAQGGLGGVGVENLLLQNGGSIITAAKDFIEGSRSISFNEYLQENSNSTFEDYINNTSIVEWDTFKHKYSIFDLGENHYFESGYAHDNFVYKNMTAEGYTKTVSALEDYLKNLPSDVNNTTNSGTTGNTNQDLEVFDLPTDIDMIDESSVREVSSEEIVSKLASLNTQNEMSVQSLNRKTTMKAYNPTIEQRKEVQKKYGSYSYNRFVEIFNDSNKLKEFIRNNNITHINKIQGIVNELYPNFEFSKKISRFKVIINSLDGRTVLNIDEVVDNYAKPILIDNNVLTQFSELNSEVKVETLYKFVLGSNEIYNLLDGNLYEEIEISKLAEGLSQLLEVAKKEGYTDKVITEIESVLDIVNSDLSLEEKYNSISNIHLDINTPEGYYVYEDLFKELKSTRKVVEALEEKSYKPEEISEIILHKALRGKNNLISKAYYYRAYNYLVENGYNEENAATLIYYTYQNILDLRGTRVIGTTPSGIQIKIVNNYHGNNKLLSLDNIISMLNKASKYYSKTHLAEVTIYDSFSPRNIYCEKVQYEDYAKKHNSRLLSAATATDTKIDLWEDFDKLEIIIHEYAHTIDRHITKHFAYSELFSKSKEWINAIEKDELITSDSVTEYATSSTQEDFAEFIQEFYKNPLGTAIKYPNRYKAVLKYLNMEIDNSLVSKYLEKSIPLFYGVVDLSGILTEKGTILEFVKQYLFDNNKLNNIAKNVANELDIVYGSKLEILEDLGVEEALEQIMMDEGINQKEYLNIIENYINGKDISSNFKDTKNLKIIEMMSKEDIQYWLEDGSTNIINHNNLEYVSDKEITNSSKVYDAYDSFVDIFRKSSVDLSIFDESLLKGDITNLSTDEINTLTEYIKKGKIKLKDYNLNSESIGMIIDKVPLKKIYFFSNANIVKSFIDYFGVDALVEFDKHNNNFLLGNNGENLYNLFDYYDLSIPKSNESNKFIEVEKLIINTINGNRQSEHRTYSFNYSNLVGTEFAKAHPELFLDESAPQDLKNAFYNGKVNSGNEYNNEWSKYLEGKSVKGIIHEPLISITDTNIVEDINAIGDSSLKYKENLELLANRVSLSVDEVQTILSNKMKNLIQNSEFGIRSTSASLLQILESGKLKNQFEVNHSAFGVYNPDMRMDMEKDLFGLPRNIKYEDRPIYGMLLPKTMNSKYVTKGPGSYYSSGDGVIYIFDKTKIMKNTTLTLGDSLDQAGKVCATNLANPKYFGMFNELLSTIKTKEDLENFDFTSLYEKSVMEVGSAAYYEFQLYGEESHTLDNVKEIVFMKMPDQNIIKKLKEKNISWRVIENNNSNENNSPPIKKANKKIKLFDSMTIDGTKIKYSELKKVINDEQKLTEFINSGKYNGIDIHEIFKNIDIELFVTNQQLTKIVDLIKTLDENYRLVNIKEVYFNDSEPIVLSKEELSSLTESELNIILEISTKDGLKEHLERLQRGFNYFGSIKNLKINNNTNKYLKKFIEIMNRISKPGKSFKIYNLNEFVERDATPVLVEGFYEGVLGWGHSYDFVIEYLEKGISDIYSSKSDLLNAAAKLLRQLNEQGVHPNVDESVKKEINAFNEGRKISISNERKPRVLKNEKAIINSNQKLYNNRTISESLLYFANKHLIDLDGLMLSGEISSFERTKQNKIISENFFLPFTMQEICIGDIIGADLEAHSLFKDFDLRFDINGDVNDYAGRSNGLLEYSNTQILDILSESFSIEPICVSEIENGSYVLNTNGFHRLLVLKLHYLNEIQKANGDPEKIKAIREKYTIPVSLRKPNYTKANCFKILKELGVNISYGDSLFINEIEIKSDVQLLNYTKQVLQKEFENNSKLNDMIKVYTYESESFREFIEKHFGYEVSNTGDLSLNFETVKNETLEYSKKISDIVEEYVIFDALDENGHIKFEYITNLIKNYKYDSVIKLIDNKDITFEHLNKKEQAFLKLYKLIYDSNINSKVLDKYEYINENGKISHKLIVKMLENFELSNIEKIANSDLINISEYTLQEQTYLKHGSVFGEFVSYNRIDECIDNAGNLKLELVETELRRGSYSWTYSYIEEIANNYPELLGNFTLQEQAYMKICSILGKHISYSNINDYIDQNGKIKNTLIELLLQNKSYNDIVDIATYFNDLLTNFTLQEQTYMKICSAVGEYIPYTNISDYIDEGGKVKLYLIEKLLSEKLYENIEQILYNPMLEFSEFSLNENQYIAFYSNEQYHTFKIPNVFVDDFGMISSKITRILESNNVKDIQLQNYISFEKNKHLIQLYFGDAGKEINDMFVKGKTVFEIISKLKGLEKIKFINFLKNTKQGQFLEKLNYRELNSLCNYCREAYRNYNSALRDKDYSDKYINRDIEYIDSAIEKFGGLQEKVKLSRFINVNAFEKSIYAEYFKGVDLTDLNKLFYTFKLLEGKKFEDLAYMSTTVRDQRLMSGRIKLEFVANKGTKAAYVNQLSGQYNREYEMLLARGTVLRIDEVLPCKSGEDYITIRCVIENTDRS